ncbi:MAG: iron-sulfur cluster assembly scaffold protein [Deltaproteobacteria bacterium]|nr:MAG: iron-sulfur cluster assembly scaffold protein [Deltaproteobacteria bacterium]
MRSWEAPATSRSRRGCRRRCRTSPSSPRPTTSTACAPSSAICSHEGAPHLAGRGTRRRNGPGAGRARPVRQRDRRQGNRARARGPGACRRGILDGVAHRRDGAGRRPRGRRGPAHRGGHGGARRRGIEDLLDGRSPRAGRAPRAGTREVQGGSGAEARILRSARADGRAGRVLGGSARVRSPRGGRRRRATRAGGRLASDGSARPGARRARARGGADVEERRSRASRNALVGGGARKLGGRRDAYLRDGRQGDDPRSRPPAPLRRRAAHAQGARAAGRRRPLLRRHFASVAALSNGRCARRAGSSVSGLYGKVIDDHGKRPRNRGSLEEPDAAHEDVNPLCGDRIRIELRLEDGRIAEARFGGSACMVAVASASLLTEMVRSLPPGEAAALTLDRIVSEMHAELRPARLSCAELPLSVLRGAVKQLPER